MTKKRADLEHLELLKDKKIISEKEYQAQKEMCEKQTTANSIQSYSHNVSNLQTRVINTHQPQYQSPTTYVTYSPYSYYPQYPSMQYYQGVYGYYSGYGGYQYPQAQSVYQQVAVQGQTSLVTPAQFYSTQPAQYPTNNWQYQTYQMQ